MSKNLLLRHLLILAVAMVAVFSVACSSKKDGGGDVAATVDGRKIYLSYAMYAKYRGKYRMSE